jgi:hypothetical protein
MKERKEREEGMRERERERVRESSERESGDSP